jgi:hypothetical protein
MQDQHTTDGVGTEEGSHEVATPIQDDVSIEETGSHDVTTPESEGTSIEELKAEKARAVTASIQKHKEAKTARAEFENIRGTLERSVRSNPEILLEIQKENPGLADELSQKVYQKSVDEAVNPPQEVYGASADDIRRVFREERQREQYAEEQRKIERLEVDFFLEKDIDPSSQVFKSVIATYEKFKPNTYAEAQEILEMAYAKEELARKGKPARAGDVDAVYTPRSRASVPSKQPKSSLSKAALEMARKMGIKDKYLQ